MTAAGDAAVFEEHRELMFALAYRMLGTVADAEDAIQDAWLRWSAAPRHDVTAPRAYLTRVVINTTLNRLRDAAARREAYVGPWLPEPLLTEPGPGAEERAELAESVSLAMLVVLQTLSPQERAVFVLREVFGFGYAEIAAALGRSEASARQLAHRAREHVQARRPRFEVDAGRREKVTRRFLQAAMGGDIEELMSVLAPGVTLVTDGGGKARAARRPVTGAARVARFLLGISGRPYQGFAAAEMSFTPAQINGGPGLLVTAGGGAIVAFAWEIADDRVTAIRVIANPDKLGALSEGRTLRL